MSKVCVRTASGKVECGVPVRGARRGFGNDEEEFDPEAEPNEPDESDLTTEDHIHFYQDGKLVLTVGDEIEGQPSWKHDLEPASDRDMWRAINAYMAKTQFWPNVWWISDHGNAHRMQSPTERSREGLLKAQRRRAKR